MVANEHDPQTLVDRAIGIIYTQVKALLQQMTIVIDVDAMRYDMLAEVLDVLHFKPSDMDEDLLAIVEAGEDSLETFTDIVAFLTNRVPEELMEFIHSVPMEVIEVIRNTLQQNIDNVQSATAGATDVVHVVNKHQGLVGMVTTVGMESLNNGVVYSDATTLLNEHRERLLSSTPEKVADDLISIALHVKTPNDALQDEVMFYVDTMYDDIFTTQQIFKHVRARLKQLSE
ncbi:hypothetical protein D3C86_1590310 [compost metagenome]